MIDPISAILWLGTLAAGAIAAWIYYRQLKTMQLTALIPYLESEAVRSARALVMEKRGYIAMNSYDIKRPWDPKLRRAAAEVCAAYNVAGLLACLKKVDSDFLIAHWGDSAKRLKRILTTYIDTCRDEEGHRYLSGFVWLAVEAEKTSLRSTCQ